ncbi:MAG: glycosyltransferase family 39 protein [Elusimicrobia bacterium]|nr:glycosyltransferase family 39 protein [Elusimicrobiota bacterium]
MSLLEGLEPKHRRALAWVFAVALLLRLAYGVLRATGPSEAIPSPDAYVDLALSLADTGAYSHQGAPSAVREPAFPLLLALFFKIFGKSYWTAFGLNCLGSMASLALLYSCGRMLFSAPVALTAAAIGAVYPPFIFYTAKLVRETFMGFWCLLGIWLALKARARGGLAAFAGAGASFSLAALTNTTLLPFGLAGAPAAFLVLGPRDWRLLARRLAVYGAVFAAVYAPWPLRNHRTLGEWILGSTSGGGVVFYVYQVVPQEVAGTEEENRIMDQDPVNQRLRGLPLAAREKAFWKAGFEKIRSDPARFGRLFAWRLAAFWSVWPKPRALYDHPYSLLKWISIASDGWIIPLGFLGMLLFRLRDPGAACFHSLTLSILLTYSFVCIGNRYRFPAMPGLVLFAAYALHAAWERLRGPSASPSGAAAG